jgi:uncharacterized DUF497 family protein
LTAKFDFEWDDAKAESNLRKHGISFQAATLAFEDSHVAEVDASRASDGEIRTKAIALIDGYFVCVVFTLRGRAVRLISARRANPKEEKLYGDRTLSI